MCPSVPPSWHEAPVDIEGWQRSKPWAPARDRDTKTVDCSAQALCVCSLTSLCPSISCGDLTARNFLPVGSIISLRPKTLTPKRGSGCRWGGRGHPQQRARQCLSRTATVQCYFSFTASPPMGLAQDNARKVLLERFMTKNLLQRVRCRTIRACPPPVLIQRHHRWASSKIMPANCCSIGRAFADARFGVEDHELPDEVVASPKHQCYDRCTLVCKCSIAGHLISAMSRLPNWVDGSGVRTFSQRSARRIQFLQILIHSLFGSKFG